MFELFLVVKKKLQRMNWIDKGFARFLNEIVTFNIFDFR